MTGSSQQGHRPPGPMRRQGGCSPSTTARRGSGPPAVFRSRAAGTRKLTQAHQLWWDRGMYLASTPEANDLLERNPLALLIGMLLDQHMVVRTLATVQVPRNS